MGRMLNVPPWVNDSSTNQLGARMTKNGRNTQSADRSRFMFEHVDQRGRVRLLPLTEETQQFLAMGMLTARNRTEDRGGTGHSKAKNGTQSFTAREWQVFDLLLSGLSSKQIAYELDISSRTVEIHRANLMRKMGVRNTVSLIRAAFAAA
jgi:DNA-binding NarL/FixJ family response regulator